LFTGLFKGSTTTLDGIGLRPMPAERPKTLRKLKSVYDASPTEPPAVNTTNLSRNGQATERINGVEDEVRRRSNTTSSTQSGDKSLSILSPFDEQVKYTSYYYNYIVLHISLFLFTCQFQLDRLIPLVHIFYAHIQTKYVST
jgi:hypothetical protein